jgi:hypothetical protein
MSRLQRVYFGAPDTDIIREILGSNLGPETGYTD